MCKLSARLFGFVVIFNLDSVFFFSKMTNWKRLWNINCKINGGTRWNSRSERSESVGQTGCLQSAILTLKRLKSLSWLKLKSILITQFIHSDICNLILNSLNSHWSHKRETCSHIFLFFIFKRFTSSSPLTCCKVWRRLPWQHPSRWCGWRPSQPAGYWSRSGSLLGWSSWGGTWERRSTASPGLGASRRGHSYTP